MKLTHTNFSLNLLASNNKSINLIWWTSSSKCLWYLRWRGLTSMGEMHFHSQRRKLHYVKTCHESNFCLAKMNRWNGHVYFFLSLWLSGGGAIFVDEWRYGYSRVVACVTPLKIEIYERRGNLFLPSQKMAWNERKRSDVW